MEAEIALFFTISALFLSWVYFTGPWRRKSHKMTKSTTSKTVREIIDKETLEKKQFSEESEGAEMINTRKTSSTESRGNGSRRSSRKTSEGIKLGHKISSASFDGDDVSDLIIDPRDIKPVPVGLRMPAESSDPDSVKQYVKELRAHQEDDMTEEEMQQEKEVQQQQLAEIFRLMQNSQEKFGIDSLDDIEEQMKLYAKT